MKEKRKRIVKGEDHKKESPIIGDNSLLYLPLDEFKKKFQKPFYELSKEHKNIIHKIKTNEDMRTVPPKKTSLRLELETYVYAWNTRLKEAVKTMDVVALLRNAHPAYRSSFATQAFEKGLISNEERSEFVMGSIARQHSRTNWFQ